MYLFFTILLPLFLFLLLINHLRRKKIIKQICSLCAEEKYSLLNELIAPLGYSYFPSQDIFSTRVDAWQREFGYSALYDKAASHFGMVFDCLPIYFNYQGKTWLLELWKGQYGINTGCEMGIYHANRILQSDELANTQFQTIEDKDMLKMSISLYGEDIKVTQLSKVHWWLTAFHMGCFSHPHDLILNASITFPTQEMTNAFVQGLLNCGYSFREIRRHYNTITFSFDNNLPQKGFIRKTAQFFNRFWCRIFLYITKPFCLSMDRILYLYYYLPFAFRRILRIHKFKKRRRQR